MTKHKRINLTQIEAFLESAGPEAGGTVVYDLIAELKKSYETIDYLATHAMVTGDFCPMCLTPLDENCQHIIWEVDLAPLERGYSR